IEHIVLNHPVASIQYNLQKDPFVSFKLNLAMDASINDRLSLDSKAHQFDIISQPQDAITSDYLHESFQIHIKELQSFDYYFKRIPDPALNGKAFPKFVVCGRTRTNEIVTEEKRKNAIVLPSWGGKTDLGETSSLLRKFVADVCNEMPDSMRSNLPKHQKETLNKLLTPPSIPWGYVLKRFIGTIPDGHRKTRARLNRRQPLRYDISGSINNRIIKLVVAIDTSGSMDKKALERIMAEIFSIVGARKCVVTIIECDTTIQRIYQVKREQDISYDVQGRGGTSYIPVIEYLNQNRYFRDAILIYFTDGEGDCSIPRPLTAKVLWVLQDEDCVLSVRNPYGEIAVMNQKST
ncbi:MAG: hypothetical protein J6D04_02335, partial [Clostridia bacterium]|nr:hypothetical protein [Clostridia bacterium]